MYELKNLSINLVSWLPTKLFNATLTICLNSMLLAFAIHKRIELLHASARFSVQFLYLLFIILLLTESPLGSGACFLVESVLCTSANGGLLRVRKAAVDCCRIGVAYECSMVGHRFRNSAAIADAPAGSAFLPRFHVSDVVLTIHR